VTSWSTLSNASRRAFIPCVCLIHHDRRRNWRLLKRQITLLDETRTTSQYETYCAWTAGGMSKGPHALHCGSLKQILISQSCPRITYDKMTHKRMLLIGEVFVAWNDHHDYANL
jgi:hypothetical protein